MDYDSINEAWGERVYEDAIELVLEMGYEEDWNSAEFLALIEEKMEYLWQFVPEGPLD